MRPAAMTGNGSLGRSGAVSTLPQGARHRDRSLSPKTEGPEVGGRQVAGAAIYPAAGGSGSGGKSPEKMSPTNSSE